MTARRQDTPFPDLCRFEFSDGRICSLPATLGMYCRSHAGLHKQRAPVEEDLSSELLQFFSGPDGSLDVHRALERVFKALSANRITNRRAATFGYLGQLILLSKPGSGSPSLSKSDLHDMCDITMSLLRTACPTKTNTKPDAKPGQPSSSVPEASPEPKRRAG